MPTAHYEILAKLDAGGRPTGFFQMARRCRTVFGIPLIFCDHLHPNIASARTCQYFASLDQEEEFTPLFGRFY
jgi:hypothetical protein